MGISSEPSHETMTTSPTSTSNSADTAYTGCKVKDDEGQ
jgi:hypothetical protein